MFVFEIHKNFVLRNWEMVEKIKTEADECYLRICTTFFRWIKNFTYTSYIFYYYFENSSANYALVLDILKFFKNTSLQQ